jgi:Xaa-Pro aminopeptidase
MGIPQGLPHEGYDATRPLEAGMVISIETEMVHPRRGFIKVEDTVAVTEEGCEGFAIRGGAGTGQDDDRGWPRL